eukprot:GFUD01039132.1.p1 GENE.GFUD01039132.1~~GFUD01039132.1.p1  ORF type:complete len:339 (+),score=83.65 GFUD01039132.1:60-1076(+)
MPPLYSGSADEWCYLGNPSKDPPFSFEFIIDNFEEEMDHTKAINKLESCEFSVKGFKFHLLVVPEGLEDDGFYQKGHVGVSLVNDNDKELIVTCTFTVVDQVRKFTENQIESKQAWGFGKFLTNEKCKEKLINGSLTVKAEVDVHVVDEKVMIQGKGKPSTLVSETAVSTKIFMDMEFTDFTIICQGKSFPCHKAFLGACSPVFKTMLETKMIEAESCTAELICTEEVCESFIKFIYTNKVDEEVLKANVASFLDLGEKYDMPKLKAMAEQSMVVSLDKTNMLAFFLAGDLYKGERIRAAAKAFLRCNRRNLLQQEGWKEALEDQAELVLEILESFCI